MRSADRDGGGRRRCGEQRLELGGEELYSCIARFELRRNELAAVSVRLWGGNRIAGASMGADWRSGKTAAWMGP